MADIYRIKDWEPFETAQSKNYKTLNWVCLTNKHDGGSYRRLMARDDAMTIYAAWLMIVQVASKCSPRGTLINDGKPITAEDIHFKTGGPIEAFEKAFEILSSPEIDWLETITSNPTEVQAITSKSTEVDFSLPTNPPHHNKPNITNQNRNGVGYKDFFEKFGIDLDVVGKVSDKLVRITDIKGMKELRFIDRIAIMSQLEYTTEKIILEAAKAVKSVSPQPAVPLAYFRKCLQNRIDNFEERLAEIP